MPPVRPERTGWRDQALSERHRLWGWDCPAVDIDFLMIEYNRGIPTALVEYKDLRARNIDTAHPSYRAIIDLSNRASLPVFEVRYDSTSWRFTPNPLNQIAKDIYQDRYTMGEREYVRFLYALRRLDNRIPDEYEPVTLAPAQMYSNTTGQAHFRI